MADDTDTTDRAAAVLASLADLADQRDTINAQIRALVRANVAADTTRPTLPVTQAAAARALHVDRNTIRGWLNIRRRTRDAPRPTNNHHPQQPPPTQVVT